FPDDTAFPSVVQVELGRCFFPSEAARLQHASGQKITHRIPGYSEKKVSAYLDHEFKRIFRLSRGMAEALTTRFEQSPFFPTVVQGRRQISAGKTVLVTLADTGLQESICYS
ncbi:hypothetical protein V5799_003074, partial [Amblyomma americanum]